MSRLVDVAARSKTIQLKGKAYTLKSLEVEDLVEIEEWLEARPLEKVGKQIVALGKAIDVKKQQKMIDAALKESGEIGIDSISAFKFLSSIEGSRFIFWLCLKKSHPELKQEDVFKLITIDNFKSIQAATDSISGLVGEEGRDGEGENEPLGESVSTGKSFTAASRNNTDGHPDRSEA